MADRRATLLDRDATLVVVFAATALGAAFGGAAGARFGATSARYVSSRVEPYPSGAAHGADGGRVRAGADGGPAAAGGAGVASEEAEDPCRAIRRLLFGRENTLMLRDCDGREEEVATADVECVRADGQDAGSAAGVVFRLRFSPPCKKGRGI